MRKTYTTKADYDEDQRHQLPPRTINGFRVGAMMVTGTHPAGMRYHYTRPWVSIFEFLATLSTPLSSGDTIAIIGTGFGWEVEIATRLGYVAIGVETSPYVELVRGTSYEADYRIMLVENGLDPDADAGAALLAEWLIDGRTTATILNEDLSTRASLSAVKSSLGVPQGQKIDWAISANVLPVLDDSEAEDMNASMFNLADNVAHYTPVGSAQDGSQGDNQKGVGLNYNWKSLMAWKVLLPPAKILRTVRPIKTVVDGAPTWPRLSVESV